MTCHEGAPRTRREVLGSALAFTASATALPGTARAASPGVSATDILIGQPLTLQGGRNAYGRAVVEGVALVMDAVNAAGGIHGRRLVLRTLDDDNDAQRAGALARQLVTEGVFALFGCIEGGPSTEVAKAAAELGVPLIGPMAGPPTLRRPHQPMVFPVRAEHREEFRALMAWARQTGLRRVGFFHADSEGGRQHLANVRLIADELGLTVSLALPLKSQVTEADFAAMAAQIGQSGTEVVINHGSPGPYEKLIRAARAAGLRTTFMGVNSGSSQLAASLGPLAPGMVFSQVLPSPWERKRELARDYQDAMRRARPQGELTYGGLEGFATARLLVLALKAAGRDLSREGLVRALEQGRFDLGGVPVRYAPGDHEGSRYVDLAMVDRQGRFIH